MITFYYVPNFEREDDRKEWIAVGKPGSDDYSKQLTFSNGRLHGRIISELFLECFKEYRFEELPSDIQEKFKDCYNKYKEDYKKFMK